MKNSILDEVVYFCKELNPTGALMLTGEWGCGKTYLIENDVKNELKDSHIIVRISLFGISSIDELNKYVKKRWVDECAPFFKNKGNEGLLSVGKMVLDTLGKTVGTAIPVAGKLAQTALTINPVDFVSMSSIIKGKKNVEKRVVLVFDDLERSKLNTTDILGCINEYCENLRFLVIVIANEDVIDNHYKDSKSTTTIKLESDLSDKKNKELKNQKNDSSNRLNTININLIHDDQNVKLSYSEIKEKVICRTVHYIPEYDKIIKSIIESKDNGFGIQYSHFLSSNMDKVINLFEYDLNQEKDNSDGSEYAVRPKNIRSFKCALHDFERVYLILKDEKIKKEDLEDNFLAFIVMVIAYKAHIIERCISYDRLFLYDKLEKIFPFINLKALFLTEKDWIFDGIWDGEALKQEILEKKEREKRIKKSQEPKELLKICNVFELDDETVKNGFKGLLQDCYAGQLAFRDYFQFIYNARFMRENDFPQYNEIDWVCVKNGIVACIEHVKRNGNYADVIKQNHSHKWIEDIYRKDYVKDELLAYDLLTQFIDEGGINFDQNRKLLMDSIRDSSIKTLAFSENKRFDRFDKEMADAISESYDLSSQADKNIFPNYFTGIWGNINREKWFKKTETIDGLKRLVENLKSLEKKYEDDHKKIATISIKKFIEEVKRIENKFQDNENALAQK